MKEPIYYKNRKGEKHYLREVRSKKGNPRYYIIKNIEKYKKEELLTKIPASFEFYEAPSDARVSLRKIFPLPFSLDELGIVAKVMKEQRHFDDFLLDQTKGELMVYVTHLRREEFEFLDEEHFSLTQWYRDVLLFKKNKDQAYIVHRFCRLSSHFGWIPLETHKDLDYLAKKYCPHILKDSLLQFWIEGEKEKQYVQIRLKN